MKYAQRSQQRVRSRNPRGGFTLVEVAISVAAFSLVLAFAFGLFAQLNQAAISNDSMARTQSGLRAAMDEIQRGLRCAGAEIDYAAGQQAVVHGSSFQVAINANLMPLSDPTGTGFPQALRVDQANAAVPSGGGAVYMPPASFVTGAETIVFTLDSNGDGVVESGDKGDDIEERSANPNDYTLYMDVYGWDGSANTLDRRPLALLRGPEPNGDGQFTPPIFRYWIDDDDDRATASVLHGDTNGDGELSGGEIVGIAPLDDDELARVDRIGIVLTGETASPEADVQDNDGYRRLSLDSEISLRQAPRVTAIVHGRVFKDENSNGIPDVGEPGLVGVTLRSSTGMTGRSGLNGAYQLAVPPGLQTISEDDPAGFVSTTANTLNLDLHPGEFLRVDFGDAPSSGMAEIYGYVYHDLDQNGIRSIEEPGIASVGLSVDDGASTLTEANGYYHVSVTVGTRVISEVDSTGYTSTTPNSVTVVLTTDGQSEQVDFGDVFLSDSGTVQGWVFEDTNRDGIRDQEEEGIPAARIQVGATIVESDNQGFFSASVPAGSYDVVEIDPPGYTSTTPNTLAGMLIEADQVYTVYFGDVVEEDVDFDIIELAETEHALSIVARDLREDFRGDPDLILGTRYTGGVNNLLVWHNQRTGIRTPNSALFDPTPTFSRGTIGDVMTVSAHDWDRDGDADVFTGFTSPEPNKMGVWHTSLGYLPNSCSAYYATQGGEAVLDVDLADFNNDGHKDLLIGVQEDDSSGHFEVWFSDGQGGFYLQPGNVYRDEANLAGGLLGSAVAVEAADVNGDGWMDAVVGSVDGSDISSVHVFMHMAGHNEMMFEPWQSFSVYGTITEVLAVDMAEDDAHDVDICVATQIWSTSGGIELWLQGPAQHFGIDNEGEWVRNDWMDLDGAPLSMVAMRMDSDVYPDLVIGTRSGMEYQGYLELARTFGHLPTTPERITDQSIGEVITLWAGDLNLDNIADLAAGTRNSATHGRVYLLYRQ